MEGAMKASNAATIFIVGIGVGAALGLLFAPKSGKETRDDIARTVKEGIDEIADQGKKLKRRARQTYGDAKDQIQDISYAAGKVLYQIDTSRSVLVLY